MTTIADELLNDFEDDGDDQEEEQNEGLYQDEGAPEAAGTGVTMPNAAKQQNGDMELDGDEEVPDDEEGGVNVPSHVKMEEQEDEAETKARIEKMHLQSVGDVRSVAGLMKQLEPVLEVSLPFNPRRISRVVVYKKNTALTQRPSYRKSITTRDYHRTSKRRTLAASKITPSTNF